MVRSPLRKPQFSHIIHTFSPLKEVRQADGFSEIIVASYKEGIGLLGVNTPKCTRGHESCNTSLGSQGRQRATLK